MNAMNRPLATLAAAAVGGAGLWLAGHWDMDTNGGYWAALGIVALVGLLLGVSQLRAPDTNAPGMLLVAWLPITVVAGWVIVTAQPELNTFRSHLGEWSGDMGISGVVVHLQPFAMVLALGIGLVTGFTLLTAWAMRASRDTAVVRDETPVATPATQPRVVDEHVLESDGEPTRVPPRERDVLLVP
jgi:hypothetical protein